MKTLPPNERVHLPGPLQRRGVARKPNAAPVKLSDLFGGCLIQLRVSYFRLTAALLEY
jgi:hypothetical protein